MMIVYNIKAGTAANMKTGIAACNKAQAITTTTTSVPSHNIITGVSMKLRVKSEEDSNY
jgi:hypothetical protein